MRVTTGQPEGARRRGGDVAASGVDEDGGAGSALPAFPLVLDTVRSASVSGVGLGRSPVRLGGGQAEEVFEAPASSEGQSRRLSSMRGEARESDLRAGESARPNLREQLEGSRSGLGSKRGAEGRGDGADVTRAAAKDVGAADRLAEADSRGAKADADVAGGRAGVGKAAVATNAKATVGGSGRVGAGDGAGRGLEPLGAEALKAGASGRVGAQGVQGASGGDGVEAGSLARRVGRFLAGKGGAVDGPRGGGSGGSVDAPVGAAERSGVRGRSGSAVRSGKSPASGESADRSTASEGSRSGFSKLVRAMRLQAGLHRSSATILLDPPGLGVLRVEARMEGDQLALSVRTQTAAARHRVSGRMGELRDALERLGISMTQVVVEDSLRVGGGGGQGSAESGAQWPGESRRGSGGVDGSGGRGRQDAIVPDDGAMDVLLPEAQVVDAVAGRLDVRA